MANGIAEIERIAAELEREQTHYATVMEPMAMKARHFEAYSISRGRDKEGKATRTST